MKREKKKRRQDKRREKEKQVLPVIEFQDLRRRAVSLPLCHVEHTVKVSKIFIKTLSPRISTSAPCIMLIERY